MIKCARVMTAVFLIIPSTATLWSQATASAVREYSRLQIGTTFSYTLAKVSTSSDDRFGLKGGGIDVTYFFGGRFQRVGVAVDANARTASNVQPGVGISEFSILAGPRLRAWKGMTRGHLTEIYGQALFGGVHGFNGLYPSQPFTVQSSASGLAVEAGCGMNIQWTRHLGIRPVEADYVYSRLPNNANNAQNSLRLSTGVVFSFK